MELFNAEFEVAKEILSHYRGALFNLVYRLKLRGDSSVDEINALNAELKRVSDESFSMMLTDSDLINKARFVYARSLKAIKEDLSEYSIEEIRGSK